MKKPTPNPTEGKAVQEDLIDRKELIKLLYADYEKLPTNSDYGEAQGEGLYRAIKVAKGMPNIVSPSPVEPKTLAPEKSLEEALSSLSELIRSMSMLDNKGGLAEMHKSRLASAKQVLAKYADPNEPIIVRSDTSVSEWRDVSDKPLTECMMGRDAECNHPKCPVTDEDEQNGRFCTLPLHDWRQ